MCCRDRFLLLLNSFPLKLVYIKSRIEMIEAKNKEVDSSKREDSKIRRINTRSAIVVI
jgi:hypothetical protein